VTARRYVFKALLLTGIYLANGFGQGLSPKLATSYLPLQPGLKWVLRNPSQQQPVVFEVVRQESEAFVLRSTTPWSHSEWALLPNGDQFLMRAYGEGGPLMPLPKHPVYLDFSRPAGSKWSNQLGTLAVVSRTAEVQVGEHSYRDCVQIRHQGPNLVFTFAQGIGYVQFGEGQQAFVLDASSSVLPGTAPRPRAEESSSTKSVPPATMLARPLSNSAPLIGITPNRYANEPLTMEVMTARFHQTLDAGVTFLVGNGMWSEMEPRTDQYSMGKLQQFLSAAAGANLPISFTLRGINTNARDVPSGLEHKSWADPEFQARLLALVDRIVPLVRGRARWFMFGYEIDAYFRAHPREAPEFIDLFRLVKGRVKQLAPEMQVSSTLTFHGLNLLEGPLAGLNDQLDFLALTYCPLQPDFAVEDPSVVPGDFRRIKEFAGQRKIVFQEVGYPTAPSTGSSDERQAQFYRLVFAELLRDPQAFSAVNIMTLADLSEMEAQAFAKFSGLPHNVRFRGSLGTLGLFDGSGHQKPSWTVLQTGIRNINAARRAPTQ
jgi:hypothetical protein